MRNIMSWVTEGLITLGLALLAILGLLLFAVFVRPLILIAMAGLVGAFVLTVFSPAVRAWFEAPAHY
jgi:hypothetical protein